MPVQGPQQPGFWLPGSEFFALSPNTTIALQGRRRFFMFTPSTPVPAATTSVFGQTLQIETNFVPGSGIYLHDAWLSFLPADSSGELHIISSSLGLSLSSASNFGAYQLGSPILTTLAPGGGSVAIRDQEKLIPQRDIAAMQPLLGPGTTNLFFTMVSLVQNVDPTNPHSMQVFASIIYTRLDGILE